MGVLDTHRRTEQSSGAWAEPHMFDLSVTADQVRLQDLDAAGEIRVVHDPIDLLVQNMCEYEHPETKGNLEQQKEYAQDIRAQGDEFGTWVHFPWSGVLSRFPGQEMHQNLRTSRNRNLLTHDEQTTLLGKKVAVLGLSVGSKALSQLVEGGIGGDYIIADGDYLDATNTNRIDAGYVDVGTNKVDIAAKKISEKDPWVRQTHLRGGLTAENGSVLEDADLIVEEVDNLSIKALTRLLAEKHGIPLVMAADVADKSVIDIERYDLQDSKNIPFMGKIKREEIARMAAGELTAAENSKLMLKHLGAKHLSSRMMRSAMGVGTELGGLPQLGTTATKGGADIAFAAREILLGRPMPSGRSVDSFRSTFGLGRETPVLEGAKTLVALVKHLKSMR